MTIQNLIEKHKDKLKRAPQEAQQMEQALKEAILNRCRIWFGAHWEELNVVAVDIKPAALSVTIAYGDTEVEVLHKLDNTPLVKTRISQHPLPALVWGRERFPTPLDDEKIAQIFFDAQQQEV